MINHNPHDRANSAVAAFFCISAAELCLVLMGHFVKRLDASIELLLVFFWVQLFSLVLMLPLVIVNGFGRVLNAHQGLHFLRSIVGVSAMFLMFYAYGNLELSLATMLKLLSPAFIPLVAILILGEKPTVATGVALFLALGAVWVSLNPQSTQPAHVSAVLAAAFAAFLAACGKSFVRKIGRNEAVDIIAFYFCAYALLFTSIGLSINVDHPLDRLLDLVNQAETRDSLILIAMLACTGNLLATLGFTKHRAAVVGIFTYMALPIAAVLGWLFWAESISTMKIVCAILILFAGAIGSGSRILLPLKPRKL